MLDTVFKLYWQKSKDKEYMVVKIIYVFGTAVPFCQAESMVWVTKGKFNI